MASLVYNSFVFDLASNNINPTTDTIKVMLLNSTYTPSKSHAKRSDLTGEVTGTGYTAGGNTVAATVGATDNVNNRADITLAATSWANSTITGARYAVYYKSRAGEATADELLMVDDFGADYSSSAATFSLAASTIRGNNP